MPLRISELCPSELPTYWPVNLPGRAKVDVMAWIAGSSPAMTNG
jgi:hypothetical protein